MDTELQNNKEWNHVLKQAFHGFKNCLKTEFSLHLIVGVIIITVILAFFLHCNFIEWGFLILFLGVMFSVELFNSSIEKIVDLKIKEIHPLAKAAKDLASAAECIVAIINIIGIICIFISKIVI